jgi:hypothetical protein
MILEVDSPRHALLNCAVEACLPADGELWRYDGISIRVLRVQRLAACVYVMPRHGNFDERLAFDCWFKLLAAGRLWKEKPV